MSLSTVVFEIKPYGRNCTYFRARTNRNSSITLANVRVAPRMCYDEIEHWRAVGTTRVDSSRSARALCREVMRAARGAVDRSYADPIPRREVPRYTLPLFRTSYYKHCITVQKLICDMSQVAYNDLFIITNVIQRINAEQVICTARATLFADANEQLSRALRLRTGLALHDSSDWC